MLGFVDPGILLVFISFPFTHHLPPLQPRLEDQFAARCRLLIMLLPITITPSCELAIQGVGDMFVSGCRIAGDARAL